MYSENRLIEKATNESGIDTDWYFLDKNGNMGVVASAGGMLPDSVAVDMVKLNRTIKMFRSLPIISKDIVIEQIVIEKTITFNKDQKDAYLKDVIYMTSRGFYYFDKMVQNDYYDFRYYLRASPTIPLNINMFNDDTKDLIALPLITHDIREIKIFLVNKIY